MGRIRIIAGTLRGRRIAVPEGGAVRPTADRVREALFGILGAAVPGARVLDLYAGSGALGLEAVSRGAASATLVEADPRVARVLRDNVDALAVGDRAVVVRGDAVREVEGGRLPGPFDVVLADPPYAERAGPRLLRALVDAGVLAAGAVVAVEGEASDPEPEAPPPLRHARRAVYGRVALDFLVFPDSPEPE